jgi:hypothetical protein
MAKTLNVTFLSALQYEFPFLKNWEPKEKNKATRPVTFEVKRTLDPSPVFSLDYGRLNNEVDDSFTRGITALGISNGVDWEWIELGEGFTTLADVIKPDTVYLLTKYVYRSMLVYHEPGYVAYTLYKTVPTAAVIQMEGNVAARMKAELDS